MPFAFEEATTVGLYLKEICLSLLVIIIQPRILRSDIPLNTECICH
jgi:hypothetical protein